MDKWQRIRRAETKTQKSRLEFLERIVKFMLEVGRNATTADAAKVGFVCLTTAKAWLAELQGMGLITIDNQRRHGFVIVHGVRFKDERNK